jgi:hypothetical protein
VGLRFESVAISGSVPTLLDSLFGDTKSKHSFRQFVSTGENESKYALGLRA